MAWPSLKSIFGRGSKRQTVARSRMPRLDRGDDFDLDKIVAGLTGRNWDAVNNTEENQLQWAKADGRSINEILVDYYETICNRAALEARRNPMVEGVIKSHAADVVGDAGPELQMQTDDDSWNRDAEQVWAEVARAIDGSGSLSLGEWLRQDIYQFWTTGDMLCQVVTDSLADGPIKTRVHPIAPRRLKSPKIIQPNMMLGIQRNTLGRAMMYYIEDQVMSEYGVARFTFTPVPARDILHFFESFEPGQARGFPLMASCLQAISDLREYDNAVLDAAKVQAMMAVVMWTQSDMAEFNSNPDEVTLKRQGITKAPAGWQMNGLNTTQPSAQNTEFRAERSRELGRPVGMPLMQIRLDSSGHNYSSARFDAQNYQKANRVIQGSLGRHRVRPVVELILSEAMERRLLAPRVLRADEVTFRWPQPPHVDPVKEAMAERLRLENKTLTPQLACASHGLDFETLVRDWKRANDILEKNGMPPMLGAVPSSPQELASFLGLDNTDNSAPDNKPEGKNAKAAPKKAA